MFNRLAHLLTRRAPAVTFVLLLATVAAAVEATRIQFEFSPQALLRGDDDLYRELQNFKETFAYEDSVLMIVVEATGEADVADQQLLNWQAETARRLRAVRHIDECATLATISVPRRTLGFPPSVAARPFIDEFPADEGDSDRLRRLVEQSPLLAGTLVSDDLRVSAVLVFIDPELQTVSQLSEVIDDVEQVLDEAPPPAGFRTALSGLPWIRTDTIENLQADQQRLLPLAAVLYLVTLALIFRRVSGSLLPLLAVGMGLAWTIGSVVALGATFNLVSNVLPVLLIVVGVSNCVHVLDDYAEQLPLAGADRVDAARRTVGHMGRSCLLTLFTTAVGFACLWTARSDVLRQFGWQAALGMACLYVTIIGTLGSLMQFFRPPRRSTAGAPLGHVTAVAGRAVERHPRVTLAITGVVIAGAVGIGAQVPVNSYMIETYDKEHPTLQTLRLVENRLSGLLPIEVRLQAEDPERLLDPEIFRRVREVEDYVLQEDGVLFARSYADVLHSISAGTAELRGEETGLPGSDAELERDIRQGVWVVNRVGESLGYPSFMTDDGHAGRILIKVEDIGTLRLRKVIDNLDERLQQSLPPESGVTATVTGDAYINTLAMNAVIHDLFYSLLAASLIIFATIALIFRSLRTGLIAAIPNLTPLALTLGYMGLRGYDMNVGNVIVFTISLGIAVDDSIHFLFRFREEMKRSGDVEESVIRTFEGTGRAIVITSILIVAGLSVLLFSDFVPTRRFAELTSVTMIGALIGVLLLLPACLVLFWKRPRDTDEERIAPDSGARG
jgi:hydrophobe/amphiphile efflux-3 (HAE3) family protein